MNMSIVRIAFYLGISIGLCACGGGTDSNTLNSRSISYYTSGETGTNCSPWGDGSLLRRPAMAVKFTPESYPATITSVTIHAKNNTGSDQMFNLYGFNDLLTETEVFSPVVNQSLPNSDNSIVRKTINVPPTTITSGSFYIVVEWVTKPLSATSGNNAFFLRSDNQINYENTSFVRYTGTAWSSLESISATAGDLGIVANY